MSVRGEIEKIIFESGDWSDPLLAAQNAADAIVKAYGVVPLADVQRFEGNSGGVSFGTAKGEGYPVYVRGAVVHSYVGYWNLAQGDDPTPAIAAQILAMREAQEAVKS